MDRNSQKEARKKNDNAPDIIILETNTTGIRCLHEIGIMELYLKGRIAQVPFVKLCFTKDLNSVRG